MSLGTNAESLHTFPAGGSQGGRAKADRFALLRTAQGLLYRKGLDPKEQKRVCWCHRAPRGEALGVWRQLDGGNARQRYGFVGQGPSAIITTLGILRPDPVSKEFFLDAYYAFSSVEEILAHTGWDLKVSPNVRVVPEPTPEELAALRRVDETGALRQAINHPKEIP